VQRLIEDAAIVQAMVQPPQGTRAWFRGRCIAKFGAAVGAINWDSIEIEVGGRMEVIDLKACVDADTANYYNQVLEEVQSVEELINRLPPERR
jgi:proteasome accessory factor A